MVLQEISIRLQELQWSGKVKKAKINGFWGYATGHIDKFGK